MIVDTHIHLDDARYDEDLDAVLERARQGGVERFIIPGADLSTLPKAIEIAERYSDVYFAIGVHPYDIQSFDMEPFKAYVGHTKCVAIGECGLDYFRLEGSLEEKAKQKAMQAEVFKKQIAFAKEYKKPLIVHIRDASSDSKKILIESDAAEVGGVLHCFNADDELLSLGQKNFYFGIGGVVTFKNAKKLVNILPRIPKEKLLIETDGPYLTPTPHRGERNEPLYTTLVAQKMAELLEISQDEVAELTTKNALKLFNIS
jgi:TatD DNase family protein